MLSKDKFDLLKIMPILLFILLFPCVAITENKGLITNEVISQDAPAWLKRNRMEKVIRKIQTKLEWSTRRIQMHWYPTESAFRKAHGQNSATVAFTRSSQGKSSIHMGPSVNNSNFDQIFGHELVHVIIYQKYKGAIPKWLEEGFANHLSGMKKVDYKWLAHQKQVDDVRDLAHPFQGQASMIHYRYQASQALAEMLEKKCDLERLIQLSVQRKIEDYIKTYCEIPDLNAEFKAWVKKKSS